MRFHPVCVQAGRTRFGDVDHARRPLIGALSAGCGVDAVRAAGLATVMTGTSRIVSGASLDTEPVSLSSAGESGCPVVLYSPQRSLLDTEDRVHLSRGTCQAETIDLAAPHYVPDARVPVPDWRIPTEEERSMLWSDAAPQAHRCVGLVRLLGPQLIRLFAARNDIFERAHDGDTLKHPLVGLLLDIIRKAGLVVGNLHSARMGRDQPGL